LTECVSNVIQDIAPWVSKFFTLLTPFFDQKALQENPKEINNFFVNEMLVLVCLFYTARTPTFENEKKHAADFSLVTDIKF
jgi:hypothetical protein